MITIHDQGTKQFYNAGGSDVVSDIDSNFTEVAASVAAIVVPVKATGAEITTGTNDTKFATPKALADAGIPVGLVKANGGEVNAGTDDAKFVTSKAITDSNVAFTADIPVKATGTEINTGTDDAKFVTPKAIADSNVAFTSDIPLVNWKTGSSTHISSITGDQTIAHGLGRVPKIVRMSMRWNNGGTAPGTNIISDGSYDGTTNSCSFYGQTYDGSTTGIGGVAAVIIYFYFTTTTEDRYSRATATVDETNITLNWTKLGSPTETISFTWEVQ